MVKNIINCICYHIAVLICFGNQMIYITLKQGADHGVSQKPATSDNQVGGTFYS